MGEKSSDLWVGQAVSGEFLFDPSIQAEAPGVVILYDSFLNECLAFRRDEAAAHIRKVNDRILAEKTIKKYIEWGKFYSSSLNKIFINGHPVISEFPKEERLTPLEARHKRHKKCVESSGRVYQGVRKAHSNRKNKCWSCKRAVFSEYHDICKACGWIVCPNCGLCGCCAPPKY